MQIQLLTVGKSNFSFIKEGVLEFESRIKHYYKFKIIELPSVKENDIRQLKKKEAVIITKSIPSGSIIVLLDEKGKSMRSVAFAQQMQKWMNRSPKNIIFIVGGAYGFDDSIKELAHEKLSLSSMTFSHQLIRLIFVEQLFRACTILKGEKYHNE